MKQIQDTIIHSYSTINAFINEILFYFVKMITSSNEPFVRAAQSAPIIQSFDNLQIFPFQCETYLTKNIVRSIH